MFFLICLLVNLLIHGYIYVSLYLLYVSVTQVNTRRQLYCFLIVDTWLNVHVCAVLFYVSGLKQMSTVLLLLQVLVCH